MMTVLDEEFKMIRRIKTHNIKYITYNKFIIYEIKTL